MHSTRENIVKLYRPIYRVKIICWFIINFFYYASCDEWNLLLDGIFCHSNVNSIVKGLETYNIVLFFLRHACLFNTVHYICACLCLQSMQSKFDLIVQSKYSHS